MQFQADITGKEVLVPSIQEFSGLGAALAAGLGAGVYAPDLLRNAGQYQSYVPGSTKTWRAEKWAAK